MFNKFFKVTVIFSLFATFAYAKQGVMFNVVDGNAEEKYQHMISKKIESIGFVLSDPHERINDAYETKYGTKTLSDGKENPQYDSQWNKNLDNLGFFTIANDVKLRELLLKKPELGGFSPFNLHIYKKMAEDKTYVGHVMPEAMLDIVGVDDKAIRDEFTAIFPPLNELVQNEIGGKVEYHEYTSLPDNPMMKFEVEFDRPEDLSEYIDEFQEQFEDAMVEKEYIIAGYKNFKESYDDMDLEFNRYDQFWVYSLCHFTFSYSIFNKGRPEAGAFAPCSMYMYIEKDSNKLVIGMPRLANWIAVLNIKDKNKIDAVAELDKEIVGIMLSIGAKKI